MRENVPYCFMDVLLFLSLRCIFSFLIFVCCFLYSIQYMRHLHDKIGVLETRTAPPKTEESDAAAAAEAAANAMYGGMGMGLMGNQTLMIENNYGGYGGGYGGYATQQPMGIPDPYQQAMPPQQMNFGGGYGGGYY